MGFSGKDGGVFSMLNTLFAPIAIANEAGKAATSALTPGEPEMDPAIAAALRRQNELAEQTRMDNETRLNQEKQRILDEENAVSAISERRAARRNQRQKQLASGGRKGTILTSPLGVVNADTQTTATTLLGA